MGEQWKVYLCFYLYIIHIFLFTTFISLSSSTHTHSARTLIWFVCVPQMSHKKSEHFVCSTMPRCYCSHILTLHSLTHTHAHNTINVFLVYYVYYFPRNNSLLSLARSLYMVSLFSYYDCYFLFVLYFLQIEVATTAIEQQWQRWQRIDSLVGARMQFRFPWQRIAMLPEYACMWVCVFVNERCQTSRSEKRFPNVCTYIRH